MDESRCGRLRGVRRSELIALLGDVASEWQIDPGGLVPETLSGGQESIVVRLADVVVRIGPDWRPTDEAEWCYSVAELLSRTCSMAIPPIRSTSGRTAVRIANRPVSLWRYVDGRSGDPTDPVDREQAAATLAAVHRAANQLTTKRRPPLSSPTAHVDSLADDQLDHWLSEFMRDRKVHVLHGDFYPGNTLFSAHELVGLVDWDEAVVAAPETELAVAACEWSGLLQSGELGGALEFVTKYVHAEGTAEPLDAEEVAQLYRMRLRWELTYEERHSGPIESLSGEARSYRLRQIALYNDLSP